MPDESKEIVWHGRYVNMVKRGSWEYADRVPQVKGIVVLIPVTDDREIVLVEQFRPPVNARVIELPAGLLDCLHTTSPHLQVPLQMRFCPFE